MEGTRISLQNKFAPLEEVYDSRKVHKQTSERGKRPQSETVRHLERGFHSLDEQSSKSEYRSVFQWKMARWTSEISKMGAEV